MIQNQLLVDLFKYRSRDKREAMEDWLTECVAAVLRVLPRPALVAVFEMLIGKDCKVLLDEKLTIDIATQVPIDSSRPGAARQRPDMLLRVQGEPWVLFENKVAHHVANRIETDGSVTSQMDRYADWLAAQPLGVDGLTKSLVFVTHQTAIPVGFLELNPNRASYRELTRHASTWGHLARIFEHVGNEFGTTSHAHAMIAAYTTFLKEHEMADEYPTTKDIALLSLQLGATDRLEKLVNDMFQRIQGVGRWNGNTSWAHADVEFGRFNADRWLHLPKGWPTDCYVNTGLWFPDSPDQKYRVLMDEELGERDLRAVSSAPKVFLQLAHGEDDMFPIGGRPGDQWLRPATDFFVFCDYESFLGDPATRAAEIMQWLDERVADLAQFVGHTKVR